MNDLLKYIKEHDIIRKYQMIFDRLFKYEELEFINDMEAREIICENEYESIVKLYEKVNNEKICDDIKKHIYSLNKPEVIKYCLRLAISKEFDDDEKKKEYIYALSESNEDVIRYAYGIASSKDYIEKKDGIEFVKEMGSCSSYLALSITNILHSKYFIDDEYSLEFIKYLKEIEEESIIEYLTYLLENEDFSVERMSLSNIIKIFQNEQSKQMQKVIKKGKK